MLSHFSANNQVASTDGVASCHDQEGCQRWVKGILTHMQQILPRAEESFSTFLLYQRNQIICPREYERVVEAVDTLGLKWREFACAIREGMLIEWYDTQTLPDLLEPFQRKQHRTSAPSTYTITLKQGRQARNLRPKTVLDMAERADYRGNACRYQMTLRCEAGAPHQSIPLIVECQYNDRPEVGNVDWLLQITGVCDPRREAEKWNADYTQRLCNCSEPERTASYAYNPSYSGGLPARRYL